MGNLGSSKESYASRCRRIYGTSTWKPYTTSKNAEANMTTITVKAWDIDASGKKYTHTLQLKVHKNRLYAFLLLWNVRERKCPVYRNLHQSWKTETASGSDKMTWIF